MDKDAILSLDTDNQGVDKFEFVVGMLLKFDLVKKEDVDPFVAQFKRLDVSETGRIVPSDLQERHRYLPSLIGKQSSCGRSAAVGVRWRHSDDVPLPAVRIFPYVRDHIHTSAQ